MFPTRSDHPPVVVHTMLERSEKETTECSSSCVSTDEYVSDLQNATWKKYILGMCWDPPNAKLFQRQIPKLPDAPLWTKDPTGMPRATPHQSKYDHSSDTETADTLREDS